MNEIAFNEPAHESTATTVGEAMRALWNNPAEFIHYWNYKGAILSGVLRAPIFLATYLIGNESVKIALGAAFVQFVFRFFFAGISGALIQSFRHVEPVWKAFLTIVLFVPLISHVFEFFLQASFGYFTGTQDLTDEAIMRSISVSIVSALFTLFAMRRGIMIVKEQESKSLLHDVSRLPVVIFHFIAFIPNEISHMIRLGAYLGVVIALAGFGLVAQILGWAVMNRMFWTYNNGRELSILKFWGVDAVALLMAAVTVSSILYSFRKKH
jgi:hypothetical protein